MHVERMEQGYGEGRQKQNVNVRGLWGNPELDGLAVRALRHYGTSRKVAGSIPDEVIGVFSWHNPSSSIMALRSTQPLTEMSTRNLLGGKEQSARNADNPTAVCEPFI
jgi:hypothetical protein